MARARTSPPKHRGNSSTPTRLSSGEATGTPLRAEGASVSTRKKRAITAAEIPWDRLSDRSAVILRQVAVPVALLCNVEDVAAKLGLSPYRVRLLMAELHDELRVLLEQENNGRASR